MSALHLKADMCGAVAHVSFGPKADIGKDYVRSGNNVATRGKITLISVNSPSCVSTSIEPPCCFTIMSWLMERPRDLNNIAVREASAHTQHRGTALQENIAALWRKARGGD